MLRSKKRRLYGWFCLLLIFVAGGATSLFIARLYLFYLITHTLERDSHLIENLIAEGFASGYSLDEPTTDKVRNVLIDTVSQVRTRAIRNREMTLPVLKKAVEDIRKLLPQDEKSQRQYTYSTIRTEVASAVPILGSFYYSLDLTLPEIYQTEEILALNFDSVLAGRKLDNTLAEALPKEILIHCLPEIRRHLPPEKQQKLDSLGENLENLAIVPRQTLLVHKEDNPN